jgi:hypothetical protein
MWQNPPARAWYEWPVLLILYVALGSIMLDLVVRFQAHTPAALGLASGVYGLVSAAVINHTAFENMPLGLLSRGLGLQVGAGFLSLMLFVTVMRGKPPQVLELLAAAAVGVAWGIWVHWYPIQESVGWGLVASETAQLFVLPALILVGLMVQFVAPRFGTFRETQFGLFWWEMILTGVPLFVALLVGMIQNAVPFIPLLLPIIIGAYCIWALDYQCPKYDPSILGNLTFIAPNLITYVIFAIIFLATGALSYSLVPDAASPVGIAMYFVVLGFGTAWLPFASGLILWAYLRKEAPPRRRGKRRSPGG